MATFDDFRHCSSTEYDYFKPERLELEKLSEEAIYVAMCSLSKKVKGETAVAVPLKVVEIQDTDVSYKIFKSKKKLAIPTFVLGITDNNFVKAEDLKVWSADITQAYLRDYNTGLDGEEPQDGIADELEIVDGIEVIERDLVTA